MNIVLVNGGFPDDALGGSELQTRFIGDCLVAAGHTVHYVALSTAETRPAEEIGGMSVHRWSRHEPRAVRIDGLSSLVRSVNADALYCRIITWLPEVERIGSELHVPVIASIASDLDLRSTSVLSAISSFRLREARKRFRLNAGHRALARADVLVAQTQTQANEAARRLGVQATVVPNFWPDLQPPIPGRSASPYVVWVGSIKPVKRPDRLVRIASGLASRGVRIVVVGEIQDAEAGRWVLDAVEQGILEYTGPLGLMETWAVIAGAAVLLNTSEAEGFANTFIQSWLSGVPVLSLGVDPDGVVETKGLGAVSHSEDEAVELVSAWLADPTILTEMGTRARRYALAVHSTAGAGGHYVSLIERTAAKASRA